MTIAVDVVILNLVYIFAKPFRAQLLTLLLLPTAKFLGGGGNVEYFVQPDVSKHQQNPRLGANNDMY